MVAAWISAETGVGPSMASGSQTCSGSCALLPAAPTKSSRPISVSAPPQAVSTGSSAAAAATERKSSVPKLTNTRNIPSRKEASPMRLTMKAFLPASVALCRSNQKPISR